MPSGRRQARATADAGAREDWVRERVALETKLRDAEQAADVAVRERSDRYAASTHAVCEALAEAFKVYQQAGTPTPRPTAASTPTPESGSVRRNGYTRIAIFSLLIVVFIILLCGAKILMGGAK